MNKKLLEYFNGDDLAASVWESKYAKDGEITPDDEKWKKIPSTNYLISNNGNVMNLGALLRKDSRGRLCKRKPKILKNRLSSNTYYITFNNNLIHRLVAEAFIPNPNMYKEVNHKDGNKANNHVNNLEWNNRSQNIQHAYNKNLRVKNPEESSKITKNEVDEIRYLYKFTTLTQKDLALKYNVKQQQISKIINFKQWK